MTRLINTLNRFACSDAIITFSIVAASIYCAIAVFTLIAY